MISLVKLAVKWWVDHLFYLSSILFQLAKFLSLNQRFLLWTCRYFSKTSISWIHKVSPLHDFSHIVERHLVTLFSSGNWHILSIPPLITSVLCQDANLSKSVIVFIIRLCASTSLCGSLSFHSWLILIDSLPHLDK